MNFGNLHTYRMVCYFLEKLPALPVRFWLHEGCVWVCENVEISTGFKIFNQNNITVNRDECDFSLARKALKIWCVLAHSWCWLNFIPHQIKIILCRTQCALEKTKLFSFYVSFERTSQENIALSIEHEENLTKTAYAQRCQKLTNYLHLSKQKGIFRFLQNDF